MHTGIVITTSEDAPKSGQNACIPLIQTLASVVSLTFPQLSYVHTYMLKAYIPVRLAGLETLAGAVRGVVLFLVIVFISGVLGQEPPLPLVWASWTKGKSSFRAVTSRVSQDGAASNGEGAGDLLEGEGAGDLLEGEGAGDLLEGEGAGDLLEGEGAGDLLEGDETDSLDGDRDGAGLLDGDEVEFLDGD